MVCLHVEDELVLGPFFLEGLLVLDLGGAHLEAIAKHYAIGLTPALAALIRSDDPNDPIARQALAYGTDQNEMADIAWQGAVPGAWGMFDESSPYYITPQEAGYPAHDREKASHSHVFGNYFTAACGWPDARD